MAPFSLPFCFTEGWLNDYDLISEMKAPRGYLSLVNRVRFGTFLFAGLAFSFAILSVALLAIWGYKGLALSSFILALLFRYASAEMSKRLLSARKVSIDPKIVFWAHATLPFEVLSSMPIEDSKCVMLHLRDGSRLEVDLSIGEMEKFLSWLKAENPTLRIGQFDG